MEPNFNIRVGADGGTHSLGLAAVEVDDTGMPIDVPYLLTVKHDGGKDTAASNQTNQVSRKASGGQARRARNRHNHRRQQRRALRREMTELGLPWVANKHLSTYEAWKARIRIAEAFIPDEFERKRLLAIALQHMERHRGWANAWVSVDSYLNAESPSEKFEEARKALAARGIISAAQVSEIQFQSQIAALGLTKHERIRPRTKASESSEAVTTANLLGSQHRADVAREWMSSAKLQGLSHDEALRLGRAAFKQERPYVPQENVGHEWIEGYRGQLRAPTAALAFQEARIRQSVANLRVRASSRDGNPRRLSLEEQQILVDTLMSITDAAKQPTWRELAEQISVDPHLITHSDPTAQLTAKAPIDRTRATIHKLKRKHPLFVWWKDAPEADRNFLVMRLCDPTPEVRNAQHAELDALFLTFTEAELEEVEKLRFDAGRSSHCIHVLELLNEEMRTTGDDYVTARNRLFNNGQHMTPGGTDLDTPPDHPTLQRIVPPFRRFLYALEREGKLPGRIVIEHVRSSFLGPQAKQDYVSEQKRNERERDLIRQEITRTHGIENPRNGQIEKYRAVRNQDCMCLYCGETIGFSTCELDHIVPRASGGSNRRANLVAVCRACNAAKGKIPFAIFAEQNSRGVTLQDAIARARQIKLDKASSAVIRSFRVEMVQRLKQRAEDVPVDERSLASTAYAAVDLRERVKTYYSKLGISDPDLAVYRGSIVSAARKATQIDKLIDLRPGIEEKSRLDRRHHAIDAAVAAMLTPTIARVLAERAEMRTSEMMTGYPTRWREHRGFTETTRAEYDTWIVHMKRLGELIAKKIAADELPVMQPLRLSTHHARLHKEGRKSLDKHPLGATWDHDLLRRVANPQIHRMLTELAGEQSELDASPHRMLKLSNGRVLTAEDDVWLFPASKAASKAAWLALPNQSAAQMGSSLHHARVFTYEARGKTKVGMVRVWNADLYDMPCGMNGDVLNSALDPWAPVVNRLDNAALQQAIRNNSAHRVGWFCANDELHLEPEAWVGEKNELGRFIAETHERAWRVASFDDGANVYIQPMRLAEEGLPEDTSSLFKKVIANRGAKISISKLFSAQGTRIVRRNALGIERLRSAALPSGWSLEDAKLSGS